MTANTTPTKAQIADIVREHLNDAYVCTRARQAWRYGTMGKDDFVAASETEMADEIAQAVLDKLEDKTDTAQRHTEVRVTKRWTDLIFVAAMVAGAPAVPEWLLALYVFVLLGCAGLLWWTDRRIEGKS